ncbi:MAG TPA: Mur ligase family protein [Candidatus Paceibacterota bacterium]|nr:Mur ligase family protein [Candidatus Paceibacterota bacterium]
MKNTTTNSQAPRRVHFIGICGVLGSAIAAALWQKGWKVTGSDSGFYPPVSTNLTKLGIPYYPGFHPEKMVAPENGGAPDLVIVGFAISSKNPELLYAQERKIQIMSFAEAAGEFLVKHAPAGHSIVVTGTYGKTTSAALLAHILKHAGLKPSYMIGGVTQDGSPSAAIGEGDWSVVEGDEYVSAKWDPRPKFAHYRPTHLLMTAVKWDHADVYPTEQSYFDAFRALIAAVPPAKPDGAGGLVLACIDTETLPRLLAESKREFISYGKRKDAAYRYENVVESREGVGFDIVCHGKAYHIQSRLLGAYNAENVTGCFALAREIGIAPGDIADAIASFPGMKRRLEKRYEHAVTVIDDIAHSAEKAKSVLANIRSVYSGLIVAVYEPNTGNRTPQSKPGYKDAFRAADTVVIPRLTKLKQPTTDNGRRTTEDRQPATIEGDELAQTIAESHNDVRYIDDDEKLVEFLTYGRSQGDVIAFLGSHGFRGMIEETIKKLAGA